MTFSSESLFVRLNQTLILFNQSEASTSELFSALSAYLLTLCNQLGAQKVSYLVLMKKSSHKMKKVLVPLLL